MNFYQNQKGLSPEQAQQKYDEAYPKHSRVYRNRYLQWQAPKFDQPTLDGILSGVLPPALSVAPFTWKYLGQELPREFVAGFVGVAQDPDTLAVRPEIGWAVRERQGTDAGVPG